MPKPGLDEGNMHGGVAQAAIASSSNARTAPVWSFQDSVDTSLWALRTGFGVLWADVA
jgi:hypothetical protein